MLLFIALKMSLLLVRFNQLQFYTLKSTNKKLMWRRRTADKYFFLDLKNIFSINILVTY